eukprot:TRINITY_DN14392_c0_g1_i1.p1 TRINITY_DN14392_c0_g1~~TRINITY_DN14392_c0_g1_i1.p1  ORF type:complete len:231 (-),score=18.80 TRINITY_DN14392_c0_g1_i1:48-713(-)
MAPESRLYLLVLAGFGIMLVLLATALHPTAFHAGANSRLPSHWATDPASRSLSLWKQARPVPPLHRPSLHTRAVLSDDAQLELTRTTTVSDHFPHGPITTLHRVGETEYYELQEGITTQETIYFKVLRRPLVNLQRRMTTYMFKIGMTVETKVTHIGTFEVSEAEQSFTFPASTVPGGLIIRGRYRSTVEFFDAAGPVFPPFIKEFTIVKRSTKFQIPPPS